MQALQKDEDIKLCERCWDLMVELSEITGADAKPLDAWRDTKRESEISTANGEFRMPEKITSVQPLTFKVHWMADKCPMAERVEATWPDTTEFSLDFIKQMIRRPEDNHALILTWRPPFLTIKCRNGQATYRLSLTNPFSERYVGTLVEATPA